MAPGPDAFGQVFVHQHEADIVVGRIEDVLQRLEFTEDQQGTGMEVDGDAWIALFHATHRGHGRADPLGQRGLGEAAPAAGQRNVVAELAQGALGRQGQGAFHVGGARF